MQLSGKDELNELLESEATFNFKNVPRAALCLFYSASLGDNCMLVFNEIKNLGGITGYAMAFLYLVFICLSMFTVLNMLIGVLCEIVNAISETSKEEIRIDYMKDTLGKVVERIDGPDGNKKISREEFDAIIDDEEAKESMIQLDVDPDAFGFVGQLLFEKENPDDEDIELEFNDFLQRVLGMRSSNPARICDVMALLKQYSLETGKVSKELETLKNQITGHSELRETAIEKFVEAMDEKICARFDPIISRLEALVYPTTRLGPSDSGSPESAKSPRSARSPRSSASPRSSPRVNEEAPFRLPPIAPASPTPAVKLDLPLDPDTPSQS
jgi:hypothetical protein